MAVRKSGSGAEKSSKGKSSGKFRLSLRGLMIVFWVLLGGLIFNLDRAGDTGIFLLKYKRFIPYPVSKLLPGESASSGIPVEEQVINAQVIEVVDGDTVNVITAHPEVKYKVRLYGIDAPEKVMKYGNEAKKVLQDKILGKDVVVKVVNTDNYGRAVGKIMLGARYINAEMVAEGYAWHYIDYAKEEYDLAAAEKNAKANRRGLWHDPKPIPPWDFRHKK